ncbi:MAG: ATP-grasp domain-containing protein [Lachnospiraceae bacterium]|nr:ATP-grasp domain-containing protein [Lachnospiraceae bacterium]
MKGKIVIVHCASTGVNYIDDIISCGYEPVIVKVDYAGTEEDKALTATQDKADAKRFKNIKIIQYDPDYQVILKQVRELSPKLILAGSEFGVELALHLSNDLGLPSNPEKLLKAMTHKDAMHESLKRYGIRYIRGKVVSTLEEAIEFYETLDSERAVVKRTRGFGTQGVTLCDNREEFIRTITNELGRQSTMDSEQIDVMVQERIEGSEYIVNTVTCQGEHYLTSMWKYHKVLLSNGTNAYSSLENITHMEIGYTEMVNYAFEVLDAIGIECGPVHAEFMIDEKGPVLIEINCRPMGGAFDRKFLDKLYGHHETDLILDSFLNPEDFKKVRQKIYEPIRKGCLKIFIFKEDMKADSAPVLSLCQRLKSYHSSIFDRVGRDSFMRKTNNLETNGGYVYLVHDDERILDSDKDLLHRLEMDFPKLLFQDATEINDVKTVDRDIVSIMKARPCRGNTLIVSDRSDDADISSETLYATVISPNEIYEAYDSYEQVILDITQEESFMDLEILFRQIMEAINKIRPTGCVLIPKSTYLRMPYGSSGMEALLIVAGVRIEVPDSGKDRVLVGRV